MLSQCIHRPLKDGWSVFKAKRHDSELKKALPSEETCFVAVTFLEANLPEALPHGKLVEIK